MNNRFSSNVHVYYTFLLVCFFAVLLKIRDQKRKYRFEKDVLVNYMAGNGPP